MPEQLIYRLSDENDQEALTLASWDSINVIYKRKLL